MVKPLEEIDRELAEIFINIATGILPYRVKNDKIYNKHSGALIVVKDHNAPGRNDKCLCGSGKKFKKCCM